MLFSILGAQELCIRKFNYTEYSKQPGREIYADKNVYYSFRKKANFKPQKLIFMFYGIGDNPENFFRSTHPTPNFFENEDVLYVLPEAPHKFKVWGPFRLRNTWANMSASDIPGPGSKAFSPDVEARIKHDIEDNRHFLFQLINDMKELYKLGWENIFLTGFSMGGIQAYDLFVNHEHLKFAAIVSGILDTQLTTRQEGKTLLSIYSACDELVPGEKSKESEEQFHKLGGTVFSHKTSCHHVGNIEAAYGGLGRWVWHFIKNIEAFQKDFPQNPERYRVLRPAEPKDDASSD